MHTFSFWPKNRAVASFSTPNPIINIWKLLYFWALYVDDRYGLRKSPWNLFWIKLENIQFAYQVYKTFFTRFFKLLHIFVPTALCNMAASFLSRFNHYNDLHASLECGTHFSKTPIVIVTHQNGTPKFIDDVQFSTAKVKHHFDWTDLAQILNFLFPFCVCLYTLSGPKQGKEKKMKGQRGIGWWSIQCALLNKNIECCRLNCTGV